MDTRSRINNSSKIRVLVAHNGSKFLVLINPTRSIRELKEEILKIYDLNTRISSNASIDGLQLLAYDGFALCDQFLISDALYDGCLLNTSAFEMDNRTLIDCPPVRSPSLVHIPKSGKATLVPTVTQRPPLIHPQTYISTDHSQTVTSSTTIQSPPVLPPPLSTQCVSQSSLMTPSTLTDLPSSQPDEEDTQNIVTLQKSSDKHPQYIPAQSLMNVYDFPNEDSENPLATGGKKTKTNNKRQKTNNTVKKTPRSKKAKKVTVSVSEDSEFEPPKQYVRKRPAPKQKDAPVKKKARKITSDVPVTNTVREELSSSWSSIENDDEQETKKDINDDETQMSENSFEIPVVGDLPSQQQKNTNTSDNKAITTIDATTNDTATNTASDTVITNTSTSNTVTTNTTNANPTIAKPATNISTNKTNRKRNGSNNVESSKATVIESTAIDDIVTGESQNKKQHHETLTKKHKSSSNTMKHKPNITSINKSNTDVQSPKKNSSQSSDKKSTAVLSPVIIKHSNSKLSSVKRTTVVKQPAPARGTKNAKKNSGDPPSVDDGVSLNLKSTKNIGILSSTVIPNEPLPDNNNTPKKQINNSNSNKSNIVLNSKDTDEKDEEVDADNDSTSEDENDNVISQTNSSASDGTHGDEVNEVSDSEGEEQPTSVRNIQISQLSSVKKSAIVQQPIPSQVRKNIISRSTPSANTKGNNGGLKSARNKDSTTIVQNGGGGPLSDSSNKPVNNNALKKQNRNDGKNEDERDEQDKDQTTDASSSSSDDDGSDTESDIIPSGQTTTHNKPSKSLQALATDADDTQRNVRMKSVNLLPPNSNVRKRLLAKTSLIKKIPLSVEKNKHKSFTSLSTQQPRQVKPNLLKKKLRVSKTPAALEGISREEEEMAFNMSQESSANLSKILDDETLWSS